MFYVWRHDDHAKSKNKSLFVHNKGVCSVSLASNKRELFVGTLKGVIKQPINVRSIIKPGTVPAYNIGYLSIGYYIFDIELDNMKSNLITNESNWHVGASFVVFQAVDFFSRFFIQYKDIA